MTEHLERDVKQIRYKVEALDASVDLLLRANRSEITKDLMDFFGKSKDRIKVFLAVDGEKTVNALVESLKPMLRNNASARLTELAGEGLIHVKKSTKHGKVYDKTEKVRILNLEKHLKKKFNLN